VSIAKALSEGTANPSLRASYIKAIVGMVLLVGVPYVVYREQINDVWSQTIGRMIDFSQEHDRMSPRPTESVPKTTP
jgi:hypothetical protein